MQLTIKQQKPLFRGNTLVYSSIAALLSYTLTGCGDRMKATPSTGENTLDLSDKTEGVIFNADTNTSTWSLTGSPETINNVTAVVNHVILTNFDDVYYGNSTGNVVWLSDGNDTAYTKFGDDVVFSGAGDDTIYTGPDNDAIYLHGGGTKTVFGGLGNDLIAIAIDSKNTTVQIKDFKTGGNVDTIKMITINETETKINEDEDVSTFKAAGLKGQIISYDDDIPDDDGAKIMVTKETGIIIITGVNFSEYNDDDIGADIQVELPDWFVFEETGDETFFNVVSASTESSISLGKAYLYHYKDTDGNTIMDSDEIFQIADIVIADTVDIESMFHYFEF